MSVSFAGRRCLVRHSLGKTDSLGGNSRRMFSVKELSWCAPSNSPNKRVKQKSREIPLSNQSNVPEPIDRFGIVAAMSRNRVIGMDGKLPWNVPEDRKLFTELTRDKVLIVGRHTYEEQPDQSHIRHVRHCIVVSSTADPGSFKDGNIVIARSFPDALATARLLSDEVKSSSDPNYLDCWIGGGQTIYEQALRHESAKEIHLSIVETKIELESIAPTSTGLPPAIAMFPAKYRWDTKFEEVSKSERPQFSYFVYNRKK